MTEPGIRQEQEQKIDPIKDQKKMESGYAMLFTDKAIHLLTTSILMTDFTKVSHNPWNITTCQDILHSVYKLRKALEENLSVYGAARNKSGNFTKVELLIRNVLRPFAVEWHGHLFENEEAKAGELITFAKRRLSKKYRRAFRSDVLQIQETVIETIKELDPEWEMYHEG